jgi:hypothetical protein
MARKNTNVTETLDEADRRDGADQSEVAPVEIIRNHDMLTENEVREYLAEGFDSLAARSVVSTEVLGEAELLGKEDKQRLIGKPMVVLGWRFNEGDFAEEFVSVLVLTEDDQYYVFNDSGAGVLVQLRNITERLERQYGPIVFKRGLRASDYWYDETAGITYTVKPDGVKTIPARTYYLAA